MKWEIINVFKPVFLLWISCFLLLSLSSIAQGRVLTIDVKESECLEGKYVLKFGMINKYTYNRHPILAFKIMRGDKILACKKISLFVPAGADGSDLHELTFDLECREEGITYQIMIFERRARGKVNFWLSDCPEEGT